MPHFFRPLLKHFSGKHFQCDGVKTEVHQWVHTLNPQFLSVGIKQVVVYNPDKYLNHSGNYVDIYVGATNRNVILFEVTY
jgi:hypothetical protein